MIKTIQCLVRIVDNDWATIQQKLNDGWKITQISTAAAAVGYRYEEEAMYSERTFKRNAREFHSFCYVVLEKSLSVK